VQCTPAVRPRRSTSCACRHYRHEDHELVCCKHLWTQAKGRERRRAPQISVCLDLDGTAVVRRFGATHTRTPTRVQAGWSQAGGSLVLVARMRAANAPRVPLTEGVSSSDAMARLVRCVSVTDANLQGNQDSYLLGPLFLTISRNPSIRTLSTHWPDERFRRETEQLTLVEAGRLPRLRNVKLLLSRHSLFRLTTLLF
jgi:hypothetical protein